MPRKTKSEAYAEFRHPDLTLWTAIRAAQNLGEFFEHHPVNHVSKANHREIQDRITDSLIALHEAREELRRAYRVLESANRIGDYNRNPKVKK